MQQPTAPISELPVEQIAQAALSIQANEIWFLIALGSISAIVSGARAVRDSEYFTVAKLLAFSITAGSVSVASVAFIGYACGDLLSHWLLLLGVAISVGVIGKPAEEMLQSKLKRIFDEK